MTPSSNYEDNEHPHLWGQILSPRSGAKPLRYQRWIADNDAFTGRYNWKAYIAFLQRMKDRQQTCIFAAVPDSVANPIETLDRFRYYAWRIKALGYPVALVAQDGMENLTRHWPPEYDAIFIGGTTAWKLSEEAAYCIQLAHKSGKWVHVGRVNSQKRIAHFQRLHVHSVDGTFPAHSPARAYRRLNKQLLQQPLLNP